MIISDEFSTIIEKYSDFTYNVALSWLHNHSDAEDAVQEAFISAYRAYPSFRGDSKISTWLYRIVVNVCLMKIRKIKSQAKYIQQIIDRSDVTIITNLVGNPEEAAKNNELHAIIENALSKLPPHLRDAVVLANIRGFSNKEAAGMLDITVPTLKARLHRGRLIIRALLEDVWEEHREVISKP